MKNPSPWDGKNPIQSAGAFQVPTPGNSVCSRCSSKESTIGPVFWISVVRRVPETRPTVMVDKGHGHSVQGFSHTARRFGPHSGICQLIYVPVKYRMQAGRILRINGRVHGYQTPKCPRICRAWVFHYSQRFLAEEKRRVPPHRTRVVAPAPEHLLQWIQANRVDMPACLNKYLTTVKIFAMCIAGPNARTTITSPTVKNSSCSCKVTLWSHFSKKKDRGTFELRSETFTFQEACPTSQRPPNTLGLVIERRRPPASKSASVRV